MVSTSSSVESMRALFLDTTKGLIVPIKTALSKSNFLEMFHMKSSVTDR